MLGFSRRPRRPTREELELDAARVMEERIAAGRPGPEVWRAAEEWRARRGLPRFSWYTPVGAGTSASGTPLGIGPTLDPESVVAGSVPRLAPATPFELRVVRLTAATAAFRPLA